MFDQTIATQAHNAYEAAVTGPFPDWRAVAELFRAAMQAGRVRRVAKVTAKDELADYNVDRVRLVNRSPRIAVRFMDGEAVFTHVPADSDEGGQLFRLKADSASDRLRTPFR